MSSNTQNPDYPAGAVPVVANPAEEGEVPKRRHPRMSVRNRILFFVTAWLIVLMPFLFWWNTWFGRQLSDAKLNQYLHDQQKPRHIQHALVQIGDRMARHEASVTKYYPELVALAAFPADEIRNTDAWAMGQDSSNPAFHEALLKMLRDLSPMVRGNAALALVRFGDATGKPEIMSLLQPSKIKAPKGGRVLDVTRPGTPIHQNGLVIKLRSDDQNKNETTEVRSAISGRVRSIEVRTGDRVRTGDELAVIDPGAEQVWEALRALHIIGNLNDLPAVLPYERELPNLPDRIRQQASLTEKVIRERAGQEHN